MSFLETAADDVTVAEAIAFIDSFESNHRNTGQENASNLDQTSRSSSNSGLSLSTPKRKVSRKKKSNPPGYTTQVQRRKRAELQNLRAEAQGLEEQREHPKKLSQTQHVNRDDLVTENALDCYSRDGMSSWELSVIGVDTQKRQIATSKRS
ncbi:unnamed protein product [Phytophthora lilii]|uniref:Unnamed protein product n=1 Tax=Phytophthora lilii TaxID=2077276 RepID=A0A9W6TNF8_9STRA|nr:unnamed protein product [Phytophthora lilii]